MLLPLAELLFAFCFLFVGLSWIGALGGLLLLVIFLFGMMIQMTRGNAPDCHCFGQIHSEPVGAKSFIRNVVHCMPPGRHCWSPAVTAKDIRSADQTRR